MSSVEVRRYHQWENAPKEIFEAVERLLEEVQRRAFDLFHKRGGIGGRDLDDWLQAERQLHPAAELIERERDFQIRVALPGYDPKDVQVAALPDSILLEAKASSHPDKEDGEVRFSEFSESAVCRRFDLPGGIDVEKVAAKLDKGILEITAGKGLLEGKKIEVEA
jgi:HSP20 family protein